MEGVGEGGRKERERKERSITMFWICIIRQLHLSVDEVQILSREHV